MIIRLQKKITIIRYIGAYDYIIIIIANVI